jgi:hypothetical protein
MLSALCRPPDLAGVLRGTRGLSPELPCLWEGDKPCRFGHDTRLWSSMTPQLVHLCANMHSLPYGYHFGAEWNRRHTPFRSLLACCLGLSPSGSKGRFPFPLPVAVMSGSAGSNRSTIGLCPGRQATYCQGSPSVQALSSAPYGTGGRCPLVEPENCVQVGDHTENHPRSLLCQDCHVEGEAADPGRDVSRPPVLLCGLELVQCSNYALEVAKALLPAPANVGYAELGRGPPSQRIPGPISVPPPSSGESVGHLRPSSASVPGGPPWLSRIVMTATVARKPEGCSGLLRIPVRLLLLPPRMSLVIGDEASHLLACRQAPP